MLERGQVTEVDVVIAVVSVSDLLPRHVGAQLLIVAVRNQKARSFVHKGAQYQRRKLQAPESTLDGILPRYTSNF